MFHSPAFFCFFAKIGIVIPDLIRNLYTLNEDGAIGVLK